MIGENNSFNNPPTGGSPEFKPVPPPNLPLEEDGEDPLKEFLKREEIKTLEKDLARLRETEAKQEREKIATIKAPVPSVPEKTSEGQKDLAGEKPQKQSSFLRESPTPKPKEKTLPPTPPPSPLDSLMPKKPQKSRGAFKKIFVRLALVVLVIAMVGAAFYFFRKPGGITIIPPDDQNGGQATTTQGGFNFPQSLIAADQTKIIEVSTGESLDPALQRVLAEQAAVGVLTRILAKDPSGFRPAREMLASVFGYELPTEVLEKLAGDQTLTIFGQTEGNRVAFIGKTSDKSGLISALKKWEAGKGSFKTAASQRTLFRYLTLGKNDLGICYLVIDDYFVLTSSFGSMQKIIQELDFEKKLGQLLMVGFDGKTLTPELEAFFKKYRPGALLLLGGNVENREQVKTLAAQLQSLSQKETGFPLLIAADQEGGPITRLGFLNEKTPQKEIGDNNQAFQIGQSRGNELKELGVNLNLAPVLDWSTAGDFLFERSFQKPLETAGDLAKSLIQGQKSAGILSSIKHFPGYSGISFNPENKLAELASFPEISQFKKAMEANPEFVMTSNVIYQEISSSLPFSFSPQALQLLKSALGNDVLVLSDDLAQDSLIKKFSLREVMVKPVEAGIDILIFSGYKVPVEQGLEEFFRAWRNGEISKEKAQSAVDRVSQLKNNLLK